MQQDHEIDPGVANLVSAMNESGMINTIASCEGHPKTWHPPYVFFSTSVETASRIEALLRQWGRGPNKRLSVRWMLTGQFNEKCQLKFCLRAPFYDRSAESLIRAGVQFWLRRSQVKQDLATLTELITRLQSDETVV